MLKHNSFGFIALFTNGAGLHVFTLVTFSAAPIPAPCGVVPGIRTCKYCLSLNINPGPTTRNTVHCVCNCICQ